MLKIASSTLSRSNWPSSDASGAETFGSPSVTGVMVTSRSTIAAASAITRLLAGPAAATNTKSRRGWLRLRGFTGTAFAQPMSGALLTIPISGKGIVPMGAARTVADALKKEQRRIVWRQRDRVHAITGVEELFFFRDADGDEIREAQLFERRVGGRELSLAAVDQHEIGKRSALLEELAISSK